MYANGFSRDKSTSRQGNIAKFLSVFHKFPYPVAYRVPKRISALFNAPKCPFSLLPSLIQWDDIGESRLDHKMKEWSFGSKKKYEALTLSCDKILRMPTPRAPAQTEKRKGPETSQGPEHFNRLLVSSLNYCLCGKVVKVTFDI